MRRLRSAHRAATVAVIALAAGATGVGVAHAAFAGSTSASGNVITAAPDFRAPTISELAVAKTSATTLGAVRPGNTYRVYANIADTGSPPSGVSAVTANVSALTPGQSAVALTAGSFTAGGRSFSHRSGLLMVTAAGTGTRSFSVSATDAASNARTAGGSVSVDGTAPVAADIQTTNGSIPGRPQAGDSITFTFSEPMDPDSIMPGWDGGPLTVIAGFQHVAAVDEFQVWNTAFDTQARLGTVSMGRTDFTAAQLGFLQSTMTMSGSTVTVTLGGQVVGIATTVAGNGTMRWTPSASALDAAGNAMSTAPLNEPGPADRDF